MATSILPEIKEFNSIPQLHESYAEATLKLFIEKLIQEKEADIGIRKDKNDLPKCSVVAFDSHEWEDVLIELRCRKSRFSLKISTQTEDEASTFIYYIQPDSEMENIIPEGLRKKMEDVAYNLTPTLYKGKF